MFFDLIVNDIINVGKNEFCALNVFPNKQIDCDHRISKLVKS